MGIHSEFHGGWECGIANNNKREWCRMLLGLSLFVSLILSIIIISQRPTLSIHLRFNRRKIMIICDILRTGAALVYILVDSKQRLWILFVGIFVQLGIGAFFDPAQQALYPTYVHPDQLTVANAIGTSTWAMVTVIASGIGGLVVSKWGLHVNFYIDSATYVCSAIIISILSRYHTILEKQGIVNLCVLFEGIS